MVSTRFPPGLAATLATVIVLGTPRVTLAQKHMNDEPPGAACQSEIRKLGAPRFGRSVTSPMIIRRVRPAYPTIPSGTTGGGVWIGELLIDARGRVSNAWTIREVKLTPAIPSLTKAITDAVLKWRFAPAAVDKVSVPICQTVTVNVNLKTIRDGQ